MDETGANQCRLCLQMIYDDMFDVIGEVTRQMLNALLLNLNLNKDTEFVMCLECATKLQNAVDFKTSCLKLNLTSFIGVENNTSTNQKRCLFCMSLTESGSCKLLQDKETKFLIDMVQNHIPELGLNINEGLEFCETCLLSLQNLSSFVMVCSDAEEKFKETNREAIKVHLKLNDIPVKCESVVDIEENDNSVEHITVKNEMVYEDSVEIDNLNIDIKSEEIEIKLEQYDYENTRDTTHPSNFNCTLGADTCQDNLANHVEPGKNSLEAKVYKCEKCPYTAKCKKYLTKHAVIHKQPSELKWYRCELCPYKTIRRSNLKEHILTHENISKINTYKCGNCSYEARKKNNLVRHMLNHQDPSKVPFYICEKCPYTTKQKSYIMRHKLTHDNPVNKCEHCPYRATQKSHLLTHMKTHQEISKIATYKCEKCSFRTRYKRYINIHILSHQDLSEITTFKCEKCSFATKYKDYLKTHMLTHQDLSEVRSFKCEYCPYIGKRKVYLKVHMQTHQKHLV